MKIKISSPKNGWLAAAYLTLVLIGGLKLSGLQNSSNAPPPHRIPGEIRLPSLTDFSDRPLVVRKKISAEPQTQAALPATAFSFVVTKKIVPSATGALNETASSPSQMPLPVTTAVAPVKTIPRSLPAADSPPLSSAALAFVDRWLEPGLISRLMTEAEASSSFPPASLPAAAAVSPAADPPRETAVVTAVSDRAVVSPGVVPAPNRTIDAGSPAADRPQKPAAPMTASAPESAAVNKQFPSLPYSLQLSSCRSLKNARYAAADFGKRGLDPFIVKTYLKNNGGSWWRVLYGQYSSVEAALRAKRDLRLSESIVKRTRFANLIGEYETRDLTIEMKNRLEALGFSAYTVKKADRGYRLLVGAFTRKNQAEEQALELQTKGMMCRVVDR